MPEIAPSRKGASECDQLQVEPNVIVRHASNCVETASHWQRRRRRRRYDDDGHNDDGGAQRAAAAAAALASAIVAATRLPSACRAGSPASTPMLYATACCLAPATSIAHDNARPRQADVRMYTAAELTVRLVPCPCHVRGAFTRSLCPHVLAAPTNFRPRSSPRATPSMVQLATVPTAHACHLSAHLACLSSLHPSHMQPALLARA